MNITEVIYFFILVEKSRFSLFALFCLNTESLLIKFFCLNILHKLPLDSPIVMIKIICCNNDIVVINSSKGIVLALLYVVHHRCTDKFLRQDCFYFWFVENVNPREGSHGWPMKQMSWIIWKGQRSDNRQLFSTVCF